MGVREEFKKIERTENYGPKTAGREERTENYGPKTTGDKDGPKRAELDGRTENDVYEF